MKQINIKKAGMLVHNKPFIQDCNKLRKLLNSWSVSDVIKQKNIASEIALRLITTVNEYRVSLVVIYSILRVSRPTMNRVLGDKKRFVSKDKKQNLIVNRIHNARLIIAGLKSHKSVAEAEKVCLATVYNWVNDYKAYGDSMTTRAIAFRRQSTTELYV